MDKPTIHIPRLSKAGLASIDAFRDACIAYGREQGRIGLIDQMAMEVKAGENFVRLHLPPEAIAAMRVIKEKK